METVIVVVHVGVHVGLANVAVAPTGRPDTENVTGETGLPCVAHAVMVVSPDDPGRTAIGPELLS